MTACNDCWDEAFRRSQIGGGHQAEHYEALLLVPATERPWCGFAQRNGYVTPNAEVRPCSCGIGVVGAQTSHRSDAIEHRAYPEECRAIPPAERATGAIVPERQRCICPDDICLDHCRACNHSGRDLEEACIADPDWLPDDGRGE